MTWGINIQWVHIHVNPVYILTLIFTSIFDNQFYSAEIKRSRLWSDICPVLCSFMSRTLNCCSCMSHRYNAVYILYTVCTDYMLHHLGLLQDIVHRSTCNYLSFLHLLSFTCIFQRTLLSSWNALSFQSFLISIKNSLIC